MVFIRARKNQAPQKGKPTDVTVLAQLTLDYRNPSAYFQHSTGTWDGVGGLFLSARKSHFPISPSSGRRNIWFSIECTMVHTKGNASLQPSDPQIPFLVYLLCISKHMLASWPFSPPPPPPTPSNSQVVPDYSSLLTQ